jgi:hypothetical protein
LKRIGVEIDTVAQEALSRMIEDAHEHEIERSWSDSVTVGHSRFRPAATRLQPG